MAEEKQPMLERIVAQDIMQEDVEVINPTMSIGQVAHLMLRSNANEYLVVDANRKVEGIVTLTDFFVLLDRVAKESGTMPEALKGARLHEKIAAYRDQPVVMLMSRQVISITPTTSLHDIVDAVVKWKIHTFPVIDNNRLVGIVRRHDVLNATFVYG
jgi:CBS domain-containing protein